MRFSTGRLQLARKPAGRISLQRIDRETNFFNLMTSAAFKGAFFVASLARRNPSQAHPVLTGRTHWALDVGQRITHHPTKVKTIFISSSGGLSGARLTCKFWFAGPPFFRNQGKLPEFAYRRVRSERPYPSVRVRAPADRPAARKGMISSFCRKQRPKVSDRRNFSSGAVCCCFRAPEVPRPIIENSDSSAPKPLCPRHLQRARPSLRCHPPQLSLPRR